MDENLIRRIHVAAHSDGTPVERLRELVGELVRSFGSVERPESVQMDRAELAELFSAVARRLSFYDALEARRFKPAVGAKIAPRKIHPRIPHGLKRYCAE
jgi:hypothetical protein